MRGVFVRSVRVREFAVPPLDVIEEPAREKVEDVQQIFLLVLIDLLKIDLTNLLHKSASAVHGG